MCVCSSWCDLTTQYSEWKHYFSPSLPPRLIAVNSVDSVFSAQTKQYWLSSHEMSSESLKVSQKNWKRVTCCDCLILCKAYVARQLNRYNKKKKKQSSRREGGFQGRLSTGQIAIILAGLATNSSTVAWAENLQACFHPTFHLSAPFPKTHQSWKRAHSQKDLLKMHAAKIWLKPLLTRHRVKDARPRRRVCWRPGGVVRG